MIQSAPRMRRFFWRVAIIYGWATMSAAPWMGSSVIHAQRVQNLIAAPSININDGFHENIGVGGFGFGLAGPGGVAPPFGGFDPNSGARFGIGSGRGGINFSAAQGSSRSIVSETPMVMVPNGGSGGFFSGSVRPFVTGIVPVVGNGGGPLIVNPWQQRLREMQARGESLAPTPRDLHNDVSTPKPPAVAKRDSPLKLGAASTERPPSERPAMFRNSSPTGSLSELRRLRAAELADEREQARRRILHARAAVAEGKTAIARNDYRVALQLVQKSDPWRPRIIERLRALERASASGDQP